MYTYEFYLYCRADDSLIDSTRFFNCHNRDDAMARVKQLFMFQGLRLSKYKYTLRRMVS
jgi:hypothetical protein